MKREKKRFINILLIFLLVFSTFSPSFAFAEEGGTVVPGTEIPIEDSITPENEDTKTEEPREGAPVPGGGTGTSEPAQDIKVEVELPEGYFSLDGDLRVYDKTTNTVFTVYGSHGVFELEDQRIKNSHEYQLELAGRLNDSTNEYTAFYYDFKEMTGEQLKEFKNWTLPEELVEVKPEDFSKLGLEINNLYLKSNITTAVSSVERIQLRNDISIWTSPRILKIVLEGTNPGTEDKYYLVKELNVTKSSTYSFLSEKENAININTSDDKAKLLQVSLYTKDQGISIWQQDNNGITNGIFVSPGTYNLYVTTSYSFDESEQEDDGTTASATIFKASWENKDLALSSNDEFALPAIPTKVELDWDNISGTWFYPRVKIYSNSFTVQYIEMAGPLSALLEIKNSKEALIEPKEYHNQSILYPGGVTLTKPLAGQGEVTYSIKNGDEVLVTGKKEFDLQKEVDKDIKGVVVTAEDAAGNPLENGFVYLYERKNPQTYDANYGQNGYNLVQVYNTQIKKQGEAFEGFIPNAYLLAGREYELVVRSSNPTDSVIYHKSLKAGELKTIHFDSKDLTKLNVTTKKSYPVSAVTISIVDKAERKVIAYPVLVYPEQNIYVQTGMDLLLNANLIDIEKDEGYYYSEILHTENGKELSVDLDSLETIEIAPAEGYAKAKVSIATHWSTENFVSKYHVSKKLYDLSYGSSLLTYLSFESEGYEYIVQQYQPNISSNITLKMEKEFHGNIDSLHYGNRQLNFYVGYYSNTGDQYLYSVKKAYSKPDNIENDGISFKALNEHGEWQTISNREGSTYEIAPEDELIGSGCSSSNLLRYQVNKEDKIIEDEIMADDVNFIYASLPEEKGTYQLKLVEQLFPKTFATLSLEQDFLFSDEQKPSEDAIVEFSLSPSEGYEFSTWNTPQVGLVHQFTSGTNVYHNNYYLRYQEGSYKLLGNFNIKPDDELYLTVSGIYTQTTSTGSTFPIPFYDYKKLTGEELFNLNGDTYQVSDDLLEVSFENEYKDIKDQVVYRLESVLEGNWPSQFVTYPSINSQDQLTLIKDGKYVVHLTGSNGEDAFYSIKSEVIDVKESTEITMEKEELVEVVLQDAGRIVPFEKFTTRIGNTYSWYGYYYPNERRLIKKLYITPGDTELMFQRTVIGDNETPWAYEYSTGLKSFTGNTSLDVGTDITAEITDFSTYFNSNTKKTSLYGNISLKSGDLFVKSIGLYRESKFAPFSLLTQPIREYKGIFDYYDPIPYTVSIENGDTTLYKAEQDFYSSSIYLERELATGKYTLKFEIPVGPNKSTVATRAITVGSDKFVNVYHPQNNTLTNKKEVTIAGETKANESVIVKLFEKGSEIAVDQKTVTADANGKFQTSFTVAKDGSYYVEAFMATDSEISSNSISFVVDTTAPELPKLSEVTQVGNKVTLNWNEDADVDHYDVYYWKDGETTPEKPAQSVTSNSVSFTGLLNGTKYNFKVVAFDKAGNSSVSETSFITNSFGISDLKVTTQTSSSKYINIDSDLSVELTGSYGEGYEAFAKVKYNKDQVADVSLLVDSQTVNDGVGTYKGTWTVKKGITSVEEVVVWIVKPDGDSTEKTDELSYRVNQQVGATLTGTIVNANENTKVRLVGTRVMTVTPVDGKYSFEGIPAGTYRIDVVHNGITQSYEKTNIKAELGQVTTISEITLPNLATVTLTFPKGIGEVDYISLYGYNNDYDYQYSSYYKWKPEIKDGKYTITTLAEGTNYYLYVEKAGYVSFVMDGITIEETTEINVGLKKGLTVSGEVTDAHGKKIPNAEISFQGDNIYNWARTDAAGKFEAVGVKQTPFNVEVRAEGYKKKLIKVTKEDLEKITDSKLILDKIVLEPSDFIEGIVLDADDKPISRAYVYLSGDSWGWTYTDHNGEFVLRNLDEEDGLYTINVSHGKTYTIDQLKANDFVTIKLGENPTHEIGDELKATLIAPEFTSNKEIVVRGTATPKSKLEVLVDGKVEFAIDEVSRRSWDGKITLPAEDGKDSEHKVQARVTKGDETDTSKEITVNYVDALPKVTDAKFTAGYQLMNVVLNPYESLPRYPIMENSTEIELSVEFDKTVDSAKIRFNGSEYKMGLKNGKYTGKVGYGWRSAGNQLFEICYKVGDREICLPLMEVMVLIDPAGYVFEGSMENRLPGVTATVFEKVDSVWKQWNAAAVGQVNPQVTGEDGRYRWDVPQGEWLVRYNKEGYQSYTSRVIPVPPPETELNVPLVRLEQPKLVSITPADNATSVATNSTITVTFDQLMNLKTIDQISINKVTTDEEGEVTRTPVEFTVSDDTKVYAGYKRTPEEDRNGHVYYEYQPDESKKLAKEIILKPTRAFDANATYEVVIGEEFADYDGKLVDGGEKMVTFTTANDSSNGDGGSTGPIGGGGGGALPPATETTVVEKETTSDGRIKVVAKVDEKALEESLKKQASVDKVSFTIEKGKGEIAELSISPAALDVIAKKNAKAKVEVKTADAVLILPIADINLDTLAKKLGTKKENVSIVISMSEASDNKNVLGANKLTAKSSIIEFKVVALSGEKQEYISSFNEYLVREIVATGNLSSNSTVVRLNDDGTFTAVPTSIHGNKATFVSFTNSKYTIVENEVSFKDVKSDFWAKGEIEKLAGKFIINGMPTGDFAPTKSTTRAEFAALLTRSLGLSTVNAYDARFKDVKGNEWFAKELTAAVKAGLIEGHENGTFAPNATVTREQAATMMARALKIASIENTQIDTSKKLDRFTDKNKISSWASKEVETLVQAGIIDGRPDKTFAPQDNLQRAEVAKMLERYLTKAKLMN